MNTHTHIEAKFTFKLKESHIYASEIDLDELQVIKEVYDFTAEHDKKKYPTLEDKKNLIIKQMKITLAAGENFEHVRDLNMEFKVKEVA